MVQKNHTNFVLILFRFFVWWWVRNSLNQIMLEVQRFWTYTVAFHFHRSFYPRGHVHTVLYHFSILCAWMWDLNLWRLGNSRHKPFVIHHRIPKELTLRSNELIRIISRIRQRCATFIVLIWLETITNGSWLRSWCKHISISCGHLIQLSGNLWFYRVSNYPKLFGMVELRRWVAWS